MCHCKVNMLDIPPYTVILDLNVVTFEHPKIIKPSAEKTGARVLVDPLLTIVNLPDMSSGFYLYL